MRRILIILFSFFLFVGCSNTINIQYDSNYGVRYDIFPTESTNRTQYIQIYLDPINEDIISRIKIGTFVKDSEGLKIETINSLLTEYNSSLEHIDQFPVSYIYDSYESGELSYKGYKETIVINFYEKNINKDAKDLINYIGLSDELSDGILYYQEELIKSQSFRYKNIIQKGEFQNNISLLNDPKYTYPK